MRTPSATRSALHDGGGSAQVLDAAVGARPDEDGVDLDVPQRRAGLEAHVGEGVRGGEPVALVGERLGIRARRPTAAGPVRGWCPT